MMNVLSGSFSDAGGAALVARGGLFGAIFALKRKYLDHTSGIPPTARELCCRFDVDFIKTSMKKEK